jgi:hypothetical protein
MHREVAELAGLIEQAADLLLAHGETHWANWLRLDAQRIRNLDLRGVEHMLTAYGGMGSINDLILHPHNGHKLDESEVEVTNDRLGGLLGRIYDLAWRLRREELSAQRDSGKPKGT